MAELRSASAAAVTRDTILGSLRTEAVNLLQTIGWPSAPDDIDAVRSEMVAADAELRRGARLLIAAGGGEPGELSRRRHIALSVIVGAILVSAVLAILTAHTLVGIWPAVAPLVVGVGGGVRWFTAWLHRQRSELRKVEANINKEIASQLSPVESDIANLRIEEVASRETIDAAAQAYDLKKKELAERETKLQEASPERLLEDLIRGTVQTGAYASRLGLVAQARHDFEMVSDMIRAINIRLESTTHIDDEKHVRLNRVVLYIDDLDRCEPVKVAQVLQAVHLLLALPLFVVVVGVDSRWVGRALQQHYPELLDGTGATPHDYLEKIFQVPFWLDRLDETKTQSMLRGLAAVTPRTERRPDQTAPQEAERRDPETERQQPEEITTPVRTRTTSTAQIARSRELNPKGLEVEQHELEAMLALVDAGHIDGSPRSLKRFINVYRLIKVPRANRWTSPTQPVQTPTTRSSCSSWRTSPATPTPPFPYSTKFVRMRMKRRYAPLSPRAGRLQTAPTGSGSTMSPDSAFGWQVPQRRSQIQPHQDSSKSSRRRQARRTPPLTLQPDGIPRETASGSRALKGGPGAPDVPYCAPRLAYVGDVRRRRSVRRVLL